MIKTETLRLGELKTNTYLLEFNDEVVVIDPADDGDFISEKITKINKKFEKVLLTHGHFDHCLAASDLKLNFGAKIYLNFLDKKIFEESFKSASYFTNFSFRHKQIVDKDLSEIKAIGVGNFLIEILNTPGHTPGSTSFLIEKQGACFVGDLIFDDGTIGEYRHKYSDKKKLINSIKKIGELKESITIYPGHGNRFLVRKLKNYF